MAHTERFALGLLSVVMMSCEASKPAPAVIFERQFVTVGGHKLEMGRPIEEWEAILGKGVGDGGNSITWPQYRFAGFIGRNVCGKYFATGGLVNLSDKPGTSLLPGLGAPVQLEKCLLDKDTPLRGPTLDCGDFSDFGTVVMEKGRPYDFAYHQPDSEFNRMVMITREGTPSQVSQSLEIGPAKEIGLDLGNSPEADAFRASGKCENPPRLIFGWPRFKRSINRFWQAYFGDETKQ